MINIKAVRCRNQQAVRPAIGERHPFPQRLKGGAAARAPADIYFTAGMQGCEGLAGDALFSMLQY